MKLYYTIIFLIIVAILLLAVYIQDARPDEIDDISAIRAIMGEARGEGYYGMLLVAVALRNRGTLQGVYGYKAKFTEPQWVWDLAKKAWAESKYNRLHKGTHWGSKIIDKKWLDEMERSPEFVKVAEYKDHIFYVER